MITTTYRIDLSSMVDDITKRIQDEVDQQALDKAAATLAKFGYEKIVRCRDCKYYDGEPDMESMGEKCWRDPNHTGRSAPTMANGYCWRGERRDD